MTEPTTIALNKLTPWAGNVRKTAPDAQIDELAASIAAHGLLQPLVVRNGKGDKHEIVAGRRRYLALALLLKQKKIEPNDLIPCQIVADDANAAEISLAENVMRVAMHPADQYEAFSKLADEGMSPDDIAARFGATKTLVKQRLALGRVSPKLMAEYRAEKMDFETLSAFTLTDDHAEQERVWHGLQPYQRGAYSVRDALKGGDIPATDKRVRFVAVEAYEAAGGAVRRDLFSEGEKGIYLSDGPLLNQLVREKLEAEAAKVREEGWKWVEYRPDFDWSERSTFKRLEPTPQPLTKEQQKDINKLRAEFEKIEKTDQNAEDEDSGWERQNEIEERIAEIEDNGIFTDEQKATSGAIVTLERYGAVDIERGFVRAEDMPENEDSDGTTKNAKEEKKPDFSVALVENLTAHKTAIIAAELMDNPDVALAAVIYELALRTFSSSNAYYGASGCVGVSATHVNLKDAEDSKAFKELDKSRAKWTKRLPQDAKALWTWCLKQKRETLLELLAFCAASSVNAIKQKYDNGSNNRLPHANALAEALDIDMREWFKPTADNFFTRVGKPFILSAHVEATGKPAPATWSGMKKAELAVAAEREFAKTKWLPEPVRIGAAKIESDELEDEDYAEDEAA